MKSSLLIVFGIILIKDLGVKSDIDFTQNRISLMPDDEKHLKSIDEKLVVTCKGDADDNLKWLSPDGLDVQLSDMSRISVNKINSTLRLLFRSIKMEDAGEWTCVSNFEDGGDGKSFLMAVYVPISFENIVSVLEVKEGQDAFIQCEVFGFPEPTVHWEYDGERLDEMVLSKSEKYKQLEDGLLIQKVRYENHGEYTCKAFQTSEMGSTSIDERTVQLNVLYKPKMASHHSTVYGFLNGDADLKCDAHGHPKPEFNWYRNGKKIPKSIKSNNTHSSLLVHIKSKEDLGYYKCVAFNDLGRTEKNITVVEGKKPDMPKVFFIRGLSTDTFDLDVGAKVDPKTQNSMSINGFRFELIPKDRFEKQKSWNNSIVRDFAIADGVTYLLSSLSENTTYKVRVAARNAAGLSDFTVEKEFTTVSKLPVLTTGRSSKKSPMITAAVCVTYFVVKQIILKF